MFTGHRNSELKEASRFDELKDGLPYMKLQKKLPATMLTHYHRWIYENHRTESVERVCGLNGCREVHHRLLHLGEYKKSDIKVGEQKPYKGLREKCQQDITVSQSHNTGSQKVLCTERGSKNEEKQTDTTMVSETTGNIALRTIPVYLKNGNKRVRVNAVLDDASTKTYVNVDVAVELGLKGHKELMLVC